MTRAHGQSLLLPAARTQRPTEAELRAAGNPGRVRASHAVLQSCLLPWHPPVGVSAPGREQDPRSSWVLPLPASHTVLGRDGSGRGPSPLQPFARGPGGPWLAVTSAPPLFRPPACDRARGPAGLGSSITKTIISITKKRMKIMLRIGRKIDKEHDHNLIVSVEKDFKTTRFE